MAQYLRLAKGVGCAIFASSVVYAASPNNSDSSTQTNKYPKREPLQATKGEGGGKISKFIQGEGDVGDGRNRRYEFNHVYCSCCSNSESRNSMTSRLQESIEKAKELCERVREENGLPGLVIAITVNGKLIWDEGFGHSDLENRVEMKPETVIRIASISKSMTMAMMAKLMEEGKINIDIPIQEYLPNFPQKTFEGKPVSITTRHLLSHLSGIRHYKKKGEKDTDKDDLNDKEYFIKDHYSDVEKALKLFQDDELLYAPGTKYSYSSHAWTVVSAIIEKITDTPFPKHAKHMFGFWGLKNTFLDEHEPIIYNRTRYYSRNDKGKIINSPYVDVSYKWSGGGFLSNVYDLTQFANMLLYSLQHQSDNVTTCENGLPKNSYLKSTTIQQMWTGDCRTRQKSNPDVLYGLGFSIADIMRNCMFCKERDLVTVSHTGGAVGASSVLLVTFPKRFQFGMDVVDSQVTSSQGTCNNNNKINNHSITTTTINNNNIAMAINREDELLLKNIQSGEVKGITVAMITNLTSVGLSKTANEIASLFKWLI